jgi:hypothetical protein
MMFGLLFIAALSAQSPQVATMMGVQNKGLVARWDICNGGVGGTPTSSTTTELDLSTNGNTATWTGTQSGGISGTYYSANTRTGGCPYVGYFNGSTDTLTVPFSSAFNPTSAMTIVIWVYRLSGAYGPTPVPLYNETLNVGGYVFGDVNDGGTGNTAVYTFRVDKAGSSYSCAESSTTFNTWVMYGLVYTNGVGLKVYKNGVLNNTCNNATTTIVASTTPLNFGAIHFGGNISNVEIYNVTLTATQIANIYAAQSAEMILPHGYFWEPEIDLRRLTA